MLAMGESVTVTAAVPVLPCRVALTDNVPALTPLTFSLALAVSRATAARVVSDDVQVACPVMSTLVPSLSNPVAVMRMYCPTVIGTTLSMEMLCSGATETAIVMVAVFPE